MIEGRNSRLSLWSWIFPMLVHRMNLKKGLVLIILATIIAQYIGFLPDCND